MKNRDLPMTYRLWKNESCRLLRKVLTECRFTSEGDLLMDENHKSDIGSKDKYWPGSDQGKLLNEIDKFLNEKASLD